MGGPAARYLELALRPGPATPVTTVATQAGHHALRLALARRRRGGGGRGGGGGGGGGGGVAVNPDAIDPNDQILTLDLQIGTAPLFLAAWPDAATPAGFVMETAAVSMTQFSTRIDDGHIPRCSGAPLWVRSERFRVGLRSRHKSNHATIARHHRAAIAPLSHHHYATIAPPSRHHHRTCP